MNSELAERVEPSPKSPDWLGYSPATQEDIEKLESRLGVILPPSYKAFLSISNGWLRTTSFIDRIRPAEEVNWFRVENENWVNLYSDSGSEESDEDYYLYDEDYAGADHRAEHMQSLLQISDIDDGVYLLNPEAVTPDGEWEAWFFASWIPGARRFPSFLHLMVHDYISFRQLKEVSGKAMRLPKLKVPAPDVPRIPAERIRKKMAKAPSLEAMMEEMRSPNPKLRDKAVRTFFGKLKGRPRTSRRPDLIKPLTDLFYSADDPSVRCACIAALTEFAPDDAEAPAPLFDALSDSKPEVVLQGIFALHYFPTPRALEPLCRFVESRANVLFNENAMSQLGEMRNPAAVPTLVGVLLDTSNKFDQSFGTAAMALARCGPAGFDALKSALDHEDWRVRHAAVIGIDVSGNPESKSLLDRMQKDRDARVSSRAEMRTGAWDDDE